MHSVREAAQAQQLCDAMSLGVRACESRHGDWYARHLEQGSSEKGNFDPGSGDISACSIGFAYEIREARYAPANFTWCLTDLHLIFISYCIPTSLMLAVLLTSPHALQCEPW